METERGDCGKGSAGRAVGAGDGPHLESLCAAPHDKRGCWDALRMPEGGQGQGKGQGKGGREGLGWGAAVGGGGGFDLICNAQRRVSTRPSHAPMEEEEEEEWRRRRRGVVQLQLAQLLQLGFNWVCSCHNWPAGSCPSRSFCRLHFGQQFHRSNIPSCPPSWPPPLPPPGDGPHK